MINQKNSSKSILPAPFTIAVLLTFLTIVLALFVTEPKQKGSYFLQILSFWEQGIWNSKLLEFAIQMMLMLVLGHTLALSRPINNLIFKVIKYCSNTATAAAIITFSTILVSFLIGVWDWFLEQSLQEKSENMQVRIILH